MQAFPTISMIGLASMNIVVTTNGYPLAGSYTVVDTLDHSPGSTAISAIAAARLGARVSLAGRVGNDAAGAGIIAALAGEGIDTDRLLPELSDPTAVTVAIVSHSTGERTTFQSNGARIAKGSRVDIDTLFAKDLCYIDVDDLALFRFLADLPVHTNPNAKLLGSLSRLAESPEQSMADIISRLDAVVGSTRDVMTITGTDSKTDAIMRLQSMLPGSNLRFAAVTDGHRGAYGITPAQVFHVAPAAVTVTDTTGTGDAFAGALAFALASQWNAVEALQFCSVVAGLSTTQLGAQTGLPRMNAVRAMLDKSPPVTILD